jgi:cytochrome c
MGNRNPYRIAVDQHTGALYWGEVGPDAQTDSVERGPKGYDEINQARRAGNFGWPYFVGDNKAYMHVDFATGAPGERFDPAHPTNTSPNNTGLKDLPAAEKAFIWYPYDASPEFPLVGSGGGRTAMAGPVLYRSDFHRPARPFPAYYDKKLFIYEWMRGWIMAVTLGANGDFASMERFMSSHKFSNPMDMAFGPNGDLYVLEYGTGWFQGNDDARLLRIEYTAGNRAPVVAASVDRPAGPIPLKVALSSAGTADADGDALRYRWTISRRDGSVLRTLTGANPSFTFDRAGEYTASLTVTDAAGARSTATVPIVAGNDPPRVDVDVVGGNRSFFFPGVPVRYAVRVSDREDGSLENGRIKPEQVRVTAEYLPEGVSAAATVAPQPSPNAGRALIEAGDCLACHRVDGKSIGPAYTAVARKYRSDSAATSRLVRKIRAGGSGVWGNVVMPPHPQLSEAQAGQMVAYILSLGSASPATPVLPVSGEYTPPVSPKGPAQGAVVLRAAYTDRGAYGLTGASTEKALVLRAPTVTLATGELSPGVQRMKVPQMPVEMSMVSRSGAYAKLAQVDLTGVTAVSLLATAPKDFGAAGGVVEVRVDSATGPVLGTAEIRPVTGQAPGPASARVAFGPVAGAHDVYFVVRNEGGAAGQMLVILLTATFESPPTRP